MLIEHLSFKAYYTSFRFGSRLLQDAQLQMDGVAKLDHTLVSTLLLLFLVTLRSCIFLRFAALASRMAAIRSSVGASSSTKAYERSNVGDIHHVPILEW